MKQEYKDTEALPSRNEELKNELESARKTIAKLTKAVRGDEKS